MSSERTNDGMEPPHVDVGPVALTALACVLFLLASIAGLGWMYRSDVPAQPPAPPRPFPSPQLRTDEADELHRLQAEQRARLAGYRWVDKRAGIVAIPIERAMDIIAHRGAAAYDPIGNNKVSRVGEGSP